MISIDILTLIIWTFICVFLVILFLSVCDMAKESDFRVKEVEFEKNGPKRVYICTPHPFEAECDAVYDQYIEYSQELTRRVLNDGYVPVTPPQCLDIESLYERTMAMKSGVELVNVCDIILVGMNYGISKCMQSELSRARKNSIKIMEYKADMNDLGKEIK